MNNPLTILSATILGVGFLLQFETDAAGRSVLLEVTWIFGSYKKIWGG